MIFCKNLSFSYDVDRPLLKNIDLHIPKGKVVALMGGSGSGKTTLLRLITGMLKPSSGEILVNQQNISQLNANELQNLRKSMGMLFQFGALLTDLTVFENIAFPLQEHTKLSEQTIHDLVMMKLNAVGLRGVAHLYPSEISGGMAKRVALARSIAMDPSIVFYDEPFAGLDPISTGIIAKLIRSLNDVLNMTSVIVSHDIKETFAIADYVYLMMHGELIEHGTPEHLMQSNNAYVQQFIYGQADGPIAFHQQAVGLDETFLKI